MSSVDRQSHWDNVYASKDERSVSWFQARPDISLDLIRETGVGADAAIVDIGGGTSRLVDGLLDAGFRSIAVLDVSDVALANSKRRLGARGNDIHWIVADVTRWQPPAQAYDVWHDRAALHFLTDPRDRAAYAEQVSAGVRLGGHIIIGTFAPDGPERCSGLPVVRHDETTLMDLLGPSFTLIACRRHDHRTPAGATQRFQFSHFRRMSA